MPRKFPPRIAHVSPADAPLTLRVGWRDGSEAIVDLSAFLARFKLFAPLLRDPSLFRQVRLGEYGADIVWTDEIDMAATTLSRLADEQSGATMSAEGFRQWREGRALTLDTAARVLGLSRRMVAYYEQGDKPIPRVVALATRGLDRVAP